MAHHRAAWPQVPQLVNRNASYRHAVPLVWAGGLVFMGGLTLLSKEPITWLHSVLALLLLTVALHAYARWATYGTTQVPLWPMVCGVHLLFFGVSVFAGAWNSPSIFDGGRPFSPEVMASAMLIGLVGLAGVAAGAKAGNYFTGGKRWTSKLVPALTAVPERMRVYVILGIVSNLVLPRLGVGPEVRNVVLLVTGLVPLVAYLWMVMAIVAGHRNEVDIGLALVFVLSRMASGAGEGAGLGTIASVVMLTGFAVMVVRRRIPWVPLLITIVAVVFLQPNKGDVRRRILAGELQSDAVENSQAWFESARRGWMEAFEEGTLDKQFEVTAGRTSLLTMAGTVYSKTPDIVPFQEGKYYPLLIANFIPRFLWPDKPSVNVANRAFQVDYGLTREEDLGMVSIACGFSAEGYMNFGWPGVFLASMFAGLAVGVIETQLFGLSRGRCEVALGLALMPGLLAVESQMVQYLGGLLQSFTIAVIFFGDWGRIGRIAFRGRNPGGA